MFDSVDNYSCQISVNIDFQGGDQPLVTKRENTSMTMPRNCAMHEVGTVNDILLSCLFSCTLSFTII